MQTDSRLCLVLSQYAEESVYRDELGTIYHFPRKYYNQMNAPGASFVYYEPAKLGTGMYFGCGEIGGIRPDPERPEFYFASLVNFKRFPEPVPREGKDGALRESGAFYNTRNAVRRLDPETFDQICRDGGLEPAAEGTDSESEESGEASGLPFETSKIKVDREPQSVYQVVRKIALGEILLNPEFQRNMVWDPVRRSRLIESLLLRIPLPAFYFDGLDGDRWQVVDGLQRLSTLSDFLSAESFVLQGLEYLRPIEGMRFSDLSRGMQRDIEETPITLFIIRPDTPPEVKFTIFYRINTGGLVLTAQEIRHALFQGESTRLLKRLAESAEFYAATGGTVSDTRMDARECVLRYLAFMLQSYKEYSRPDLNHLLSSTMKRINQAGIDQILAMEHQFVEAMTRAADVLGAYAFRKFRLGYGKRGPVNKALFESWAVVLQEYDKAALMAKRELILSGLSQALNETYDYPRSLSAGTGGIRAVRERFEAANRIVRTALS